jgi:hypothetical protein
VDKIHDARNSIEAEFCTEGSGRSGSAASRPVFKIFTMSKRSPGEPAKKHRKTFKIVQVFPILTSMHRCGRDQGCSIVSNILQVCKHPECSSDFSGPEIQKRNV